MDDLKVEYLARCSALYDAILAHEGETPVAIDIMSLCLIFEGGDYTITQFIGETLGHKRFDTYAEAMNANADYYRMMAGMDLDNMDPEEEAALIASARELRDRIIADAEAQEDGD